MPELPEVEFGRKLLERTLVGHRLERVEAREDSIVFAGRGPAEVEADLRGREVLAARRRGKYLWLELSGRPWPIIHFGMTGALRVESEDPLVLASSPREEERAWPPRFTKLLLTPDSGPPVALVNKRRLGRVLFRDDPRHEPPISRLGFDPLDDPPDLADFRALLARRRRPLKSLLLDQGFAAGVGNWIADEVLYQAGLDPRRSCDSLTAGESKRLRERLIGVIQKAVAVDAVKTRFPRTWLFHRRWGKTPGQTTHRGESIEFLQIAGRTTAWVPARQK